ncbi:MAG: hypothetical protein JRI87_03560 [Deltaproteobacteria bacterium]|nr:hypothetical protein [Deltaproteobacteria bacterium]
MSEEQHAFPPYEEKMKEALKPFNAEVMNSYQGKDIRPFQNLKGKNMDSSKYLYKAPKLEKISFAVHNFKDMLMSYGIIIWPDDEHALPTFSSYWAESAKGSYFIIDFYPSADCIVDNNYMEHYLSPLEDLYEKGVKIFPDRFGRSTDWFRALVSPYCLTAEFAPTTKKTQENIMELTLGYLSIYIDLWKKDELRDPEYMKPLIERRNAIKTTFIENDPGAKMMEVALGHEMADLSIKISF